MSWYGGLTLPNFGKDIFPRLKPQDIKALPIRAINLTDTVDNDHYNHLVLLVERMLDLHRQLAAAQTPNEKSVLQRQIETTDAQIDGLVYALYGLTEAEIKIVEGK